MSVIGHFKWTDTDRELVFDKSKELHRIEFSQQRPNPIDVSRHEMAVQRKLNLEIHLSINNDKNN